MRASLLPIAVVLTGLLMVAATPGRTLAQTGVAIKIDRVWARRVDGASGGQGTGTMSRNGVMYMTLSNAGTVDDTIVSAASDAARSVELHEMTSDGAMSMRRVAKLTVPAGGQFEMKPGGYHVMLLGLMRDLKPGDTVKVTLMLEKAGPLTVTARLQ